MLIPDWTSDHLDSPVPPEAGPPQFDPELGAWILSRYDDVLAAFHASSLDPASSTGEAASDAPSEAAMQTMRAETREALSPAQLRLWREQLAPAVRTLVAQLPIDRPVDLVAGYAQPLCLTLATLVTGINPSDAARLRQLAEPVSAAAAEPFDLALKSRAEAANSELRGCFHSGPQPLRDSTFVALSHTMPCILANAWFALIEHPPQWSILHREPRLVDQAIEELLRYAGLVRILSRVANADLDLNGIRIRKGERLILRIIAANRDPAQFHGSDQVDIRRPGIKHLALGAGPHACVGASLIRLAAIAITRPLVERFSTATLSEPVAWKGGSTFRSPASLWVALGNPSS